MRDKHEKENMGLVITLLSLLFVVVMLVVAVVVLFVMNRDSGNEYGDDNLAKECLKVDGDISIKSCLEDMAWSYYEDGDCDMALKVYDDVPVDIFDEYALSDLYDDAYSMSLGCDDESLQSYWKDKFEGLSARLEARE
jgi:hypothetical protein